MKHNILIAEDDNVLREVYMKKFTLAGYDIRTVSDGNQALAAINESTPDILILDIHMPNLDGFGLLEQIPAGMRNYPVLMLTNFGDEQSQRRGNELGVNEFLIKSEMTIKTLIATVQRHLAAK